MDGDDIVALIGVLCVAAIIIAPGAAFVTHVIWGIGLLWHSSATMQQAVLMILGVLCPPVGIVHGFMLWFT